MPARTPSKGRQFREAGPVGVDCIKSVVLVAAGVLDIDDAVVVGPDITGHVSLTGFGQAGFRLRADLSDVHIQPVLPRFQEGDVFAGRRNRVMGGFGVPEKIRQGNQPGLNARNGCAHGNPGQRSQGCQCQSSC